MADDCEDLNCINGGSCYAERDGEMVNEFCLCRPEFDGDQCQTKRVCDLPCAYGDCKFPYVPPSALTDLAVNSDPYCFCDEGYSGVYCEAPINTCPDGERSCYNGATCKEIYHPDGRSFLTARYKCDCEEAGDAKNPYVGLNCHIPAEKVCSLLTDTTVSFCVNGGTCKDITTTPGAHFGCHCSDEFEGDHCEYVKGTDPMALALKEVAKEQDSKVDKNVTKQANTPDSGKGLDEILVFVIGLAIAAAIWIFLSTRQIIKKRKALQEAATAYKDDDIAFDSDGNRMTNISIGEDFEECEGEII